MSVVTAANLVNGGCNCQGEKIMLEVKLSNREIDNAKEAISLLMNKELPVKTSFALSKFLILLDNSVKLITNFNDNLIKKYGKTVKGSTSFVIEGQDWDKYQSELKELFDQEQIINIEAKVKIPEIEIISCTKCGNQINKTVALEPKIFVYLKDFIEV